MTTLSTVGFNFLFSALATGNRIALNRTKDEYFLTRRAAGSDISELEFLNRIRSHQLEFRNMPDATVLQRWGIAIPTLTQPTEYYYEELKKRAVYSEYQRFNRTMQDMQMNRDADTLNRCYNAIADFKNMVASIQVCDRYKNMSEVGQEIKQSLIHRREGREKPHIPFAWPTLQTLTGGAGPGDLIFFVGRPGMGKSTILSTCAIHAWKENFKVLFLSMEMTEIQISRRIYGSVGGYNWNVLRHGEVTDEVLNKIDETITEFEEGQQFRIVSNRQKQTVDTVTALVDELQPDAVYIDAGYLMSVANSNAKAWEKLTLISEGLKQLAVSRDIPVFISVQFNREAAKGKRFELDTIAGSDAIGQLGSIIVAITEGDEPYKDVRRKLSIVKNREGGVDSFQIFNEYDPPNFSQVADTNIHTGTIDFEEEIPI